VEGLAVLAAAWRHTGCAEPPVARSGGFTLLEMLIVIVIIGVLAMVVVPRFTASAGEAKKNSCAQIKARINSMVEVWYFRKGTWPKPNLKDIAADPDYFPEGIPKCPVDGSKYELNPATHRVKGHDHCPPAVSGTGALPLRH